MIGPICGLIISLRENMQPQCTTSQPLKFEKLLKRNIGWLVGSFQILQKIATSDNLLHRIFSFGPFFNQSLRFMGDSLERNNQCGLEVNFPNQLAT